MGEPIVALKSPMWSLRALCALKMLLAPSAYAAKAVVTLGEIAAGRQHGDPHVSVPHRLTTLWSLPAAYVVDMAETAASIWVGSDDDRTV